MKTISGMIYMAGLAAITLPAFAGQDPIGWTLNRGLPSPSSVGHTYTLRYTLTNNLPLTLVKALSITKNGLPAADFSYTDGCTGQKLASGASCNVDVTFAPLTSGDKTFQLTIGGYDDNRVPLPLLRSVAQGGTSGGNTVYGQVGTSLPANLSLGSSSTYTFNFTNGTDSDISGVTVNVTQTDGTPAFHSSCGSTLTAGKSCTVTGSYTPTSSTPTTQSVTAQFDYTGGTTITESTSGTVTSSSGVKVSFVGFNYLPAEMTGASGAKTVEALFCNNTASIVNITSATLARTTGTNGTFTQDSTTCGASLQPPSGSTPGQCCTVTGTFTPAVTGVDTQVVVTASMAYTGPAGSPATLATSTYVVPSLGTSRTITLVNNCNFPVWWSFAGAAVAGTSGSSCPAGTTQNAIKPTGECHWTNPGPTTGAYALSASGGGSDTATATIPLNVGTDPKIQWSGVISASARCDGSGANCKIAPCDVAGTALCASGGGFQGPATQAEFTFNISTTDSYDIEVINGFHIPISITPGSHTSASNYSCGVPGNFTAENGFGSCNWQNAVVPNTGYYVVLSNGTPCTIGDSCGSTAVCGINLDNVNKTTDTYCGPFVGFWTADQICGYNPAKGGAVANAFQCYTPLPSGYPANAVYFDLMKCAVPTGDDNPLYNSCYKSYSGKSATEIGRCCGCKDWWTTDSIGANSTAQSCGTQTNTIWNGTMQSQVQWMKKACPSVYTYPFDDATSGFSCSNNLPGDSNSTNYTITFCAGNNGLPTSPASLVDGRVPPPPLKG